MKKTPWGTLLGDDKHLQFQVASFAHDIKGKTFMNLVRGNLPWCQTLRSYQDTRESTQNDIQNTSLAYLKAQ